MMTYYSRYIPSFSEKVKCLYDKMNDFGDWTDNELSAFESLKNCLTSAFLALPKDDEELCLKTDVSDNCIAAV